MDFSHITNGGLILTKADCHRLTSELSEINSLLAAIHGQSFPLIQSPDADEAANTAKAIQAMAMIGCRKADAVARALGEAGFGYFEEEFAPIVLGAGEDSEED